jgi:hypothetical protein
LEEIMSDVHDDDTVAPAQPAQQDTAAWASYTDSAPTEMRIWDGVESLGGIAASEAARSLNDRWRMIYGPIRQGDYISRNPGDPVASNWWVTPASVVEQRYVAS